LPAAALKPAFKLVQTGASKPSNTTPRQIRRSRFDQITIFFQAALLAKAASTNLENTPSCKSVHERDKVSVLVHLIAGGMIFKQATHGLCAASNGKESMTFCSCPHYANANGVIGMN